MKTTVAIELDKTRNLRYDVNSLVKIEELTGKPITTITTEDIGIKDIRSIIYAGLRWESKSLTLDKVGDLMSEVMAEKGLEYLIEKISEGFELAFGSGEEKN